MLARRLAGILPPMTYEEAMEVTRIGSALGHPPPGRLVAARPFRAPHHTISYAGLVGGGSRLRPGEVTRAHNGVLFLDELPEFQRRALEALREPLEEGSIIICRGTGSVSYPARFLLVAAMNPCPCGYLGHERRACACTPFEVRAYRQRLSGPLLDRLDIFLEVRSVRPAEIVAGAHAGPARSLQRQRESLDTKTLAGAVRRARELQAARWGKGQTNGRIPVARLLEAGAFRPRALQDLERNAESLSLSARGFSRSLRVARTVADLAGSGHVELEHVEEAIHYRERGV
jgi:magnesium chelatase family protein